MSAAAPFRSGSVASRGLLAQIVLALVVGALLWGAFDHVTDAMRARGIPTNFDFWDREAGFDVNQSLIAFPLTSTNGRAFLVGLLNTLLVSTLGILFSTIVGFIVGLARLSENGIVAAYATIYVETLRNTPLLLQLLLWYNVALRLLPNLRQSLSLGDVAFLNNRGLYLPRLVLGDGAGLVLAALFAGVAAAALIAYASRLRAGPSGRRLSFGLLAAAFVVGLPLAAFFALGRPIGVEAPVLRGLNFAGGWRVLPELIALLLGLSLYTASFIAEIVRSGFQSVAKGQGEAAQALGLTRGQALRLVVAPQAARVILPPLVSQYLNLIKNSSLAVFVGYPDLVQIFGGTVLQNANAPVQIFAVIMATYLVISLAVSALMALYGKRVALVER